MLVDNDNDGGGGDVDFHDDDDGDRDNYDCVSTSFRHLKISTLGFS